MLHRFPIFAVLIAAVFPFVLAITTLHFVSVEDDVKAICESLRILDADVEHFPATNGTLEQAITVENDFLQVISCIEQGNTDMGNIPGPISNAEADIILSYGDIYGLLMTSILATVVNRKPVADALPISNINALIRDGIFRLNITTCAFAMTLADMMPQPQKEVVMANQETIAKKLADAIVAYP